MNKTKIEWVKNPDGSQGYTWNPITGCLNGCEYCYARKLANGRLKQRYLSNSRVAFCSPYDGKVDPVEQLHRHLQEPFYPRFWPEKLNQPVTIAKVKKVKGKLTAIPPKGKGIFTCDMSDLFGIGVPEVWTRNVLRVIEHTSYNRYYLLTKQPQNLAKFSPFPDNAWVGVSVDNGLKRNQWGKHLKGIEASVKYISVEPLLYAPDWWTAYNLSQSFKECGLSWIIIGAQTKPYNPPKIEWVKTIVEAADKAGVPVFLKDNMRNLLTLDNATFAYIEVPRGTHPNCDYELVLRQEMPEC